MGMTKADYDELVRLREEKVEAVSILIVLVGVIAGLSTGSPILAPCITTGCLFVSVIIQMVAAAIAEYERAQEGK